jgi:[ribosomal protein S18]-alanine N-acetyltransferase
MTDLPLPLSLVVRAAGSDDGPALEALAEECGLRFFAERDLGRPGGVVLLAQEGSAVLGFVALQLAADEAEILDLCVLASKRRRGVARKLVLDAVAEVRTRGGERLLLEVRRSNQPALALYQQLGFLAVGERKRYYDSGEDALILAWVLPR